MVLGILQTSPLTILSSSSIAVDGSRNRQPADGCLILYRIDGNRLGRFDLLNEVWQVVAMSIELGYGMINEIVPFWSGFKDTERTRWVP